MFPMHSHACTDAFSFTLFPVPSPIGEGTGKRVNEKSSVHACRVHWEHYESTSMYWELQGV